ncbi:MAG: PDZ domain-containing protein [Candidatus Omnitrophica bacterium]|nr:PDZ domain-containing protein [Candidatus Omnitrophota bacterium]
MIVTPAVAEVFPDEGSRWECRELLAKIYGIMEKEYFLPVSEERYQLFLKTLFDPETTLPQDIDPRPLYAAAKIFVWDMRDPKDLYSRFNPPDAAPEFKKKVFAVSEDLGLKVEVEDEGVRVNEVEARSDAAFQGLKVGDLITQIDDEPVNQISPEQIAEIIRPAKGETRNLTVRTADQVPRPVTVQSTEYFEKTVRTEALEKTEGLGIEGHRTDGGLKVTKVHPRSDAFTQGVQEGDVVTAVEGKSVSEIPDAQILEVLRPPTGEIKKVEYKNLKGDIISNEVESKVHMVSYPVERITQKPGVLTIAINHFNPYTFEDFSQQIGQVGPDMIRHLVIDLRGNSGGTPMAARDFVGLLVKEGEEICEVDVDRRPAPVYSPGGSVYYNGPVTVLVDSHTGSAAEFFAGILRSAAGARLVGRATEGSVALKRIYDLDGGASLYLTIARVYDRDGKPFPAEGLQPDRVIPEGEDALEAVLRELEFE